MSQLTIKDVTIRTNANGLFSLNDLHKAAGGEKRHSPNYWTDITQTQELIAEILSDTGIPVSGTGDTLPVTSHYRNSGSENMAINVIRGGTSQGTYVCRELVYAYAMWVSAAFQLEVIRAFDKQNTQDVSHTGHRTKLEIMTSELQGLKAIGFSDGVVQASAIEMDDSHYNATGSHLLPLAVREDCRLRAGDSLTWDRGVEATTRSAAAVALPHFVIHTVTEIAQSYNSKYVTATVINNILTATGYQVKLARATYIKTALSEDYAQTRIRAQGTFRGLPIITGWKMHPEFISVLTTMLHGVVQL